MMLKSLVFAAALLGSPPALGCSRDPPDDVGFASGQYIAGKMLAEASFADLAVAEARRPMVGGDPNFPVDLVTFRTLQRFKGASPDRFTLLAPNMGGRAVADRKDSLEHYVTEDGHVIPYASTRREPAVPFGGPSNSCDPGQITPEIGALYIIFRGSDGRALHSARYHDEQLRPAFPVVKTSWSGDIDDWRLPVEIAAAKWKGNELAPTQLPPRRGDVARLIFKRPQSAAAVERLLRTTGAVPFGVRLEKGVFAEESRVPYAYASLQLLADAEAAAHRHLAANGGAAIARALLAQPREEDPEARANALYAPGIQLLNAEARLQAAREGEALRIASIELRGTEADWSRLLKSPLVAGMTPGFDLRGQPALPGVQTRVTEVPWVWNVERAKVIEALQALAGKP